MECKYFGAAWTIGDLHCMCRISARREHGVIFFARHLMLWLIHNMTYQYTLQLPDMHPIDGNATLTSMFR